MVVRGPVSGAGGATSAQPTWPLVVPVRVARRPARQPGADRRVPDDRPVRADGGGLGGRTGRLGKLIRGALRDDEADGAADQPGADVAPVRPEGADHRGGRRSTGRAGSRPCWSGSTAGRRSPERGSLPSCGAEHDERAVPADQQLRRSPRRRRSKVERAGHAARGGVEHPQHAAGQRHDAAVDRLDLVRLVRTDLLVVSARRPGGRRRSADAAGAELALPTVAAGSAGRHPLPGAGRWARHRAARTGPTCRAVARAQVARQRVAAAVWTPARTPSVRPVWSGHAVRRCRIARARPLPRTAPLDRQRRTGGGADRSRLAVGEQGERRCGGRVVAARVGSVVMPGGDEVRPARRFPRAADPVRPCHPGGATTPRGQVRRSPPGRSR